MTLLSRQVGRRRLPTPLLESLDHPLRRVVPVAADQVGLADGTLQRLQSFAEVAAQLLEGRARGRPWPHLPDLVKVVLGEGADGAGCQGRLSPDRREQDLAHGIDGSTLERPALGQVELEPELGGGVAAPQDGDVTEVGAEPPQVLQGVTLPGIGDPGAGVVGDKLVMLGGVELVAQPVRLLDEALEGRDTAVGCRVHGGLSAW